MGTIGDSSQYENELLLSEYNKRGHQEYPNSEKEIKNKTVYYTLMVCYSTANLYNNFAIKLISSFYPTFSNVLVHKKLLSNTIVQVQCRSKPTGTLRPKRCLLLQYNSWRGTFLLHQRPKPQKCNNSIEGDFRLFKPHVPARKYLCHGANEVPTGY